MFTEECINTFLENQEQLFPQAVAESYEAAEAFLEDCMAQVVDSIEEVREYLEESGADVEGMSDEELEEIEFMRCRWEKLLKAGDPYYNKHFSLTKWNYSLKPFE